MSFQQSQGRGEAAARWTGAAAAAVLFAAATGGAALAGGASESFADPRLGVIGIDPTANALAAVVDDPSTAPSETGLPAYTQTPPPTPTGAAGPGWGFDRVEQQADFLPLPDRWRIGVSGNYVQNVRSPGRYLDPYNQNVLKGDYPIKGDDKFLLITATSDTLFEYRKLPIPSGMSTARPDRLDFFGFGDQFLFVQNFILAVELFEGDAAYKPRDWEIRVTPVFQINYVDLEETAGVDPDVREGTSRQDEWLGFQEAFIEKHLSDLTTNYDFWALRVGIQGFASDFRGFLFADNNRVQWNLAYFHQIEKDTNSGLNSYTLRDQDIFIANIYFQDALAYFRPSQINNDLLFGYTTQFSFHANFDHGEDGDIQLDDNGRIVRPSPVGTVQPDKDNEIQAYYLGWAGDGHIGRLNITHQYYYAFGRESFNPIAGQDVDISAHFFALELSVDQDWVRYRASFAYASGDDNPEDGRATGFDSIFDNPNFFGGGQAFFVRQQVPLTDTGVSLFQRNSFLPDLRTSKEQGQANFVNPGIFVYSAGVDFEITPKLRALTNVSYIQFDDSQVLKQLLHDNKLGTTLGIDYSIGIQYRPFLNNQWIFNAGFAAFQPLGGYKDLFESDMQYSVFLGMTLSY